MKAEPSFSLKDQLFNPEKVAYLAGLIAKAYPSFPTAAFSQKVLAAFPELKLKQRVTHMSACLHDYLPVNFPEALDILLRAQPPELNPTKTDDDFGDFILAPFSQFVADYGCTADHLHISLAALREMTKRFSAEGPIRDFINGFPEETMAFLTQCAADDNYHVRRLATEGTRPKLPWAPKINIDYRQPVPILDALYADPTRYVTRSVANHLNDIAKIDPELVVEMLGRWHAAGKQNEEEMAFITRHGLRTLIKQGNRDALNLIGFGGKPEITVVDLSTKTPQVKVGDVFEFAISIESHKKQKLLVDYIMEFATNGSKQSQKVFKIKQLEAKKDEVVTINKKHPMRMMTTRRLYAGEHRITVQVNGRPFGSLDFKLLEA